MTKMLIKKSLIIIVALCAVIYLSAWAVVAYEHYDKNRVKIVTELSGIKLEMNQDDLIFYKGQPNSKSSMTLSNVTDKQLFQHIRYLESSFTKINDSDDFDINTAKPVTDPEILKLLDETVDHSHLIDSNFSIGDLIRLAKGRGLIDPKVDKIPENLFDPARKYPLRDSWFYHDHAMTTIVSIVNGKVNRVTQVGNEKCIDCIRIGSIKYGDNYKKIIEQYGEPSGFSKSDDLTIWRLEFEKYNTYFALEKNMVTAVGAFVESID